MLVNSYISISINIRNQLWIYGTISIILLVSCGRVGENLSDGGKCTVNGTECREIDTDSGRSLPGGDQAVYYTGPQGRPGSSCSVSEDATDVTIACTDGSKVTYAKPIRGPIGPQGPTGPAGERGEPGTSCSVTQTVNGAIISCTDGTSVVVLNGSNGTNGTNGQDGVSPPASAYSVTQIVDVCGKQAAFDEVLLRLANGQLLAHYASGANQFLTVLTPGNYVTTDGTHCYFTVDNDLQISNIHN